MSRFIGRHESELTRQYGNPYDVRFDSRSRKILAFELRPWEEVRTEGTSWTDPSGVTHHNPPTVRRELQVEHRIFTMDKDGRVIKATWKLY